MMEADLIAWHDDRDTGQGAQHRETLTPIGVGVSCVLGQTRQATVFKPASSPSKSSTDDELSIHDCAHPVGVVAVELLAVRHVDPAQRVRCVTLTA